MRQIFWYSSQIAVFCFTAWFFTWPEVTKGEPTNVRAVLLMAVAATMTYMAVIWTVGEALSWLRTRLSRALRKPDKTNDGAGSIGAVTRLGQPRKLPSGRWIGKEPR